MDNRLIPNWKWGGGVPNHPSFLYQDGLVVVSKATLYALSSAARAGHVAAADELLSSVVDAGVPGRTGTPCFRFDRGEHDSGLVPEWEFLPGFRKELYARLGRTLSLCSSGARGDAARGYDINNWRRTCRSRTSWERPEWCR